MSLHLSKAFSSLGGNRLVRRVSFVAIVCGLASVLPAQTEPVPAAPAGDAPAAADQATTGRRARRNQNGENGDRPNFNPEEMQQRMATAIREQLGITDDAEWKIVQDRLTAVQEARRAAMGGAMGGMRMAGMGGPGGGQGGRMSRAGSPEQEALRQAITDKLPDAEIKSRLGRLREVRKANDEKLAHAQEELRAVLNVRQEAVAVMFGLLP